jgi:SAM-dependent methyltransferase
MDETSKSKKTWGPVELAVLQGSGIDIGCGPDPVFPNVRRFDLAEGDANTITRHVREQFDFVYASHCLEHMHEPKKAVLEWWQLVKPGGHLFFTVPDEDLYEQGVFPSRFNDDHKATFTIWKAQSWSPVSINVRDLAESLPGGRLVQLILQDHNYDRRLLRHGPDNPPGALLRLFIRGYNGLRRVGLPRLGPAESFKSRYFAIDQTARSATLAQIQCIVRKES